MVRNDTFYFIALTHLFYTRSLNAARPVSGHINKIYVRRTFDDVVLFPQEQPFILHKIIKYF